jgi:hypothetical protein
MRICRNADMVAHLDPSLRAKLRSMVADSMVRALVRQAGRGHEAGTECWLPRMHRVPASLLGCIAMPVPAPWQDAGASPCLPVLSRSTGPQPPRRSPSLHESAPLPFDAALESPPALPIPRMQSCSCYSMPVMPPTIAAACVPPPRPPRTEHRRALRPICATPPRRATCALAKPPPRPPCACARQ